jgi:hypothetical protein
MECFTSASDFGPLICCDEIYMRVANSLSTPYTKH